MARIEGLGLREWTIADRQSLDFLDDFRSYFHTSNYNAEKAYLQRQRLRRPYLSQRLWAIEDQARREIEDAVRLGIQEGGSSVDIGRKIRAHLLDPHHIPRAYHRPA